MKKILLGSTALVAAGLMAGPAFAQVELSTSGGYDFAIGIVDQDLTTDRDYDFRSLGELTFNANGTADNGLEYGARLDLDDIATDTGVSVDEAYMFLSGTFGIITLGEDDPAGDDQNVSPPDAGTGGYDGNWSNFATGALGVTATNAENDGDAAKIKYTSPNFNGIQGGISFAPDSDSPGETPDLTNDGDFNEVISIGARYEGDFGNFGVTVGGSFNTGDSSVPGFEDLSSWDIGANLSFGAIEVGAQYIDDGDSGLPSGSGADATAYALGASYSTGPWTFGANWFSGELDTPGGDVTEDVYGVMATYSVAPGLSVDADLVFFDDEVAGVSSDGSVFVVRTSIDF